MKHLFESLFSSCVCMFIHKVYKCVCMGVMCLYSSPCALNVTLYLHMPKIKLKNTLLDQDGPRLAC